jgi:hypothetical protein
MTSDAEIFLLPGNFGRRHLITQLFHYPTINLRVASLNREILETTKIPKIEFSKLSMVYAKNN